MDDEPLARQFARHHLSSLPGIQVVGECVDGDSLRAAIGEHRPTVVLLDVRMPGRSVFETLSELVAEGTALPAIIFATAYDAYAVQAFEVSAADYLLKPYARDRLRAAFERVREATVGRENAAMVDRLSQDLGPEPTRLLVPDGARLVPIPMESILWLQASDDFVTVHTRERSYLLSRTLRELETRLNGRRFIRVHRSAIVNVVHVRSVRRLGSGRLSLTLDDGTSLVASRSHAAKVRDWMV